MINHSSNTSYFSYLESHQLISNFKDCMVIIIINDNDTLSSFVGFEVTCMHATRESPLEKKMSQFSQEEKKRLTHDRQYNFIILIKGIFKLLPEATSCKEIYDKDM